MSTADHLQHRASELAAVARAFHESAQRPGSDIGTPGALESLEEALQVLSGAWYQLAADASSWIANPRRANALSREREIQLMGTLHDVAAAFARCARACRDARTTAAPIVERLAVDDYRDGRRPALSRGA